VTTYIIEGASFFFGSPLRRNTQLSVLVVEKSYDGWPPGEFSRQQVSEDETCWKDLG